MSIPLIDLRAKVTPETDVVLEALHRATGLEKSEIVREWLHEKALLEINKTIELHRLLMREGMTAASEGGKGK